MQVPLFKALLQKTCHREILLGGSYLKRHGYKRKAIPETFPDNYTVMDFCLDNPRGRFLLALDQHVVAVVDGNYYDTWDSGREIPVYYWTKGD